MTPPRGQDWFTPGRFAAILAVLVFIPFRDVLQGQQCFVVRDFGLFSLPVAGFFRDSFWRGEWPLWNPLSCCGTPFLAQLNTLTLYPPSLIYLLLPLTWALPFFCLLHLYLGGIGMYFLATRWSGSRLGGAVAGTIFAFNGLSLNFLMWPSHIATFSLVPWVVWLVEDAWQGGGRKIFLAAVVAALQVLAGGPETILFTWLFLFLIAAVQFHQRALPRWVLVRRFFVIGVVALCLAAPQILPFADLSLNSNRSSGFGNSEWSMPPSGWANFLVPRFRTSQWQQIVVQENQYWTSSYYAGVGALFLGAMALCRRRSWRVGLLGGVLAASLVLALGEKGYLLKLLQHVFPFLGLFRYPVKFVLATLCVIPLLAAYGISQYENVAGPRSGVNQFLVGSPRRGDRGRLGEPSLPAIESAFSNPDLRPPPSWRAEWICGGVLLGLIGFIVLCARRTPYEDTPWTAIALNGAGRGLALVLTIGLVVFFALRPVWRGWTGLALLGVFWGDVLTHLPWQNPTVNPSIYQPGLGLQDVHFQSGPVQAGGSRIMMSPYSARQLYYQPMTDVTKNYLLDRVVFVANCNLLDGVPKVDGFFSLYLRPIDKVLSLFDTNNVYTLGSLQDVLAISQTIAPGEVFKWVPRPAYVPWVSIGQAPVFGDEKTTLRALADSKNDFHKIIYLPPEAASSITAQRQESARIVTRQFGSTAVVINTETPAPAIVSISQAWYHNWKAYVDGNPATLWRANEAFQAVEVPAGRHELKLAYEDTAFHVGGAICVLALLISAGFCLITTTRKSAIRN